MKVTDLICTKMNLSLTLFWSRNSTIWFLGIIFSSPRCVAAVEMCSANMTQWKYTRTFVVGEKTAECVCTKLGLVPEGQTSGNSSNLASYILNRWLLLSFFYVIKLIFFFLIYMSYHFRNHHKTTSFAMWRFSQRNVK